MHVVVDARVHRSSVDARVHRSSVELLCSKPVISCMHVVVDARVHRSSVELLRSKPVISSRQKMKKGKHGRAGGKPMPATLAAVGLSKDMHTAPNTMVADYSDDSGDEGEDDFGEIIAMEEITEYGEYGSEGGLGGGLGGGMWLEQGDMEMDDPQVRVYVIFIYFLCAHGLIVA